jgi:hypothetical protein
VDESRSERAGTLAAMRESLRGYWRDATGYQRFAYTVGALLIASGAFHLGVFLLQGGSWQEPVSWRKAVTFGMSFGITTISVAWVMTFLPKRKVAGWLLMGLFGLANLAEVALVTMQAWRRQPSHFNFSTSFDSFVFGLMRNSVIVIALGIVVVTVWSFRSLHAPRSLALAIRAGLLLLVLSQLLGFLIVLNGLNVLERESIDTPAATSHDLSHLGEDGAMKVPHAVTIHGLQVLPALAWLTQFSRWSEHRRVRIVAVAVVGYAGLCLASAWQTFNGIATLDLDAAGTVGVAVSIVLLGAAFITTLRGVARAAI